MSTATQALPFPAAPAREDATYRNRYLIALTVTLASILELLDTSIVNVSIPHMMGTLGATLDQITWVSIGYVVANVIVLPITGWLSAFFGRKRYFAFSIALFTVASFFCGQAGSLEALVFWRIVQGLGGGALLSTSQAILYEVFPREEYGSAMAIFGMGVMVGPTLGPTLGGYITDTLDWRWIFFINIPFGVLALMLTLALVPDSKWAQKARKVDLFGLVLLILSIGGLQLFLERGERMEWFASAEVAAYAVVSVVSTIVFVWHELRTPHPIVDLRILRHRQFTAGVTFAFLLGMCLFAPLFVFPVYLQSLLGFTAHQTGMVILPGALASAFTMASMARLGRKMDGRILVVIGTCVFAVSMTLHSHFTTLSGGHDFLLPSILRGIGIGMIFVPLSILAMADVPQPEMANATGLFNLTRQLGGSVGIALAATMVTRFTALHRGELVGNVTVYAQATRERLALLTQGMLARGLPQSVAETDALRLLDLTVRKQAAMLAYEQIFLYFGFGLAVGLPLLLFMRGGKVAQGGDAGMAH
jgi:DHA2 family multidrug resistance protein